MSSDDRQLWQRLGCFGYYGFGGGWALGALPRPQDTNVTACGRCEQRLACWRAHKTRVAGIVPDLVALCEEIAKTHRGADYIKELRRRTGKREGDPTIEPYAMVTLGNTGDGARVGQGLKPQDRGEHTLRWPLEPIRVVGA